MTNFDLPNRYMMVGDFDSAIEELEKILQEEPQNVEAWFLLADAYEDKKDKIRCFRQILIISPDNEPAKLNLESLEKRQSVSYDALLGDLSDSASSAVEQELPVFEFENEAQPALKFAPQDESGNAAAGILDDDKKFIFLVGMLVVLIAVTVIGLF